MRAISVMLWTFVAVVVIVECWVFYSWPFGPAWKASPAKAKTAKRRRERAKATPTHTPEPVPCVDAEKPECEQDELCTWCHSTHMPSACYSKDMAIGLPSPMFACGVELPTASTKRTKANKRARQGAIKRGESSHKVNPLLRQLPDPQEADASATWDYKRRPQTGPLQVCACLLSFNRLDLLERTIRAFVRHMEVDEPQINYQLIWVDNGSDNQKGLKRIKKELFTDVDAVDHLNFNSGIAHALNRMFHEMCESPYILTLEEDWEWRTPKIMSDKDQPRRAIQLAIDVLKHDAKVMSVILREEIPMWFSSTKRSEKLYLPDGTEYRHHCLNLEANHVWGTYSNGASLMHRERLKSVGRMYGEHTLDTTGAEVPHKKGKITAAGKWIKQFPREFSEPNYAFRVGLKYCSAVIQLLDRCDSDTSVDAICNAVFIHIGEGRSHGVDVRDQEKEHDSRWILYGTEFYSQSVNSQSMDVFEKLYLLDVDEGR